MSTPVPEELIPAAVPTSNRPKREREPIALNGHPVYIRNAMAHTPLALGPVWLVPNGVAMMKGRDLTIEIEIEGNEREVVEMELGDSAIRTLRRWKARGEIATTGGSDLDGHAEPKAAPGKRQKLTWGAAR